MKLRISGEHPLERLALALGAVPVTLMDTHMAFLRARAIMTGVKIGLFDALAGGAASSMDAAAACGTDPSATDKLMSALAGAGYLRFRAGRYALSPTARAWTLSSSLRSLRDKVLFEFVEWTFVEQMEGFVRTGQPVELHGARGMTDWGAYQRAMRALAGLAAPELVSRVRLPASATAMLDIGGSHGFYSVSFCRRHPGLSSTVLDLPDAIAHAAPILARENMAARVTHRAGDARTEDLGEARWDFVLVAQLVHHFDEPTNRALLTRIAASLRPRGVVVLLELIRPSSPDQAGETGALLDLYFALTSQSGTWSPDEMQAWQRDAGLTPRKPVFLRTIPGVAAIAAVKPPS